MTLSAKDIKGVISIPPTPSRDGQSRWSDDSSIDVARTIEMVEKLVGSGVGAIALASTVGEGMGLTWDEKREFLGAAIETVKKRVPVFAGSTALGTKEAVNEMNKVKSLGANCAYMGLPMWQTPTIEVAVQFFGDLGEAVPEMPIVLHSDPRIFKFDFPVQFWQGIGISAPTVIANVMGYGTQRMIDEMRVAAHQINFIPSGLTAIQAHQAAPGRITALWTNSPWPEPLVALINAIQKDDRDKIIQVRKDIGEVISYSWPELTDHFAMYNSQIVKTDWNLSGYQNCGPLRSPFDDLPESWIIQLKNPDRLKQWAEARKKYLIAA